MLNVLADLLLWSFPGAMDQELCPMQVLCILVRPALGRFVTGGHLSSLHAVFFSYTMRDKQILFLNVCIVCDDVVSECFCATNTVSPAHQMLFFSPLSPFFFVDFWKTSGSTLKLPGKSRSSHHLTSSPDVPCAVLSCMFTSQLIFCSQKWVQKPEMGYL